MSRHQPKSIARAQRRHHTRHALSAAPVVFHMRIGGWWLYAQLLLLDRLPQHNVVRIYGSAWYLYRFLRAFRLKRIAYRLFSNTKVLWMDFRLVPGQEPKPIKSFTLKSPTIAVLVQKPVVGGSADEQKVVGCQAADAGSARPDNGQPTTDNARLAPPAQPDNRKPTTGN